jgi:hypothetical protein
MSDDKDHAKQYDSKNGQSETGPSGEEKLYVEAELIADTRDSEQKLGFRNVAPAERRMLFQAGDTYVELLIPPEGALQADGGWLFGQFIRHTDEVKQQFEPPIYAVLAGPERLSGAAKMTEEGEFAVPFQERGTFSLTLEPRNGPTVRLAFSH